MTKEDVEMNAFEITEQDGFQVIEMRWSAERPGFSIDTFDAVAEAVQAADNSPSISSTVLLGAPKCFCYGADVSIFNEVQTLSEISESALRFFRALINSKKPLIAGIDGLAAGVGMTMLLHFDAIFATPNSSFKAPFVEWGLIPDAASTTLLPEAIGYRRTFDLLCLGSELTAEEALRIGLITRVVSEEELDATVFNAARHLARLPSRSVRTARELLRQDRGRLMRKARTENNLFQVLLEDVATQQRLRVRGRAIKMALRSQKAVSLPV
jgi:enoyl-CoA hydratase/carnithine racemase